MTRASDFRPIAGRNNPLALPNGQVLWSGVIVLYPSGWVTRRRRWRSRWPSRSPRAVDTVDAGDLPASYRDGSWGHTQARDAVFTGTRRTHPTKITTFPRDEAEKSPFQQHDLSILIVGSNQLKHRLFLTSKPKSHPSSNTQCPITPVSYNPNAASSQSRQQKTGAR